MKHFLKIAAIAPVIFMAACSKNTASLGLNSDLKLSNIKVSGLSGTNSITILAVGHFTFVKDNPTTAADTMYLIDSFYVANPNGYDKSLNFSTPAGTKHLYYDRKFYVDGGQATGISIDNTEVDFNKKSIFSTGQTVGTTIDNRVFIMPTQEVTY